MTEHTTYREMLADTSKEQRDLYGHWHVLRLLQQEGITKPEGNLEQRLREEEGKGNASARRTWFGFGPERYELTALGDATIRSEQRKLIDTEEALRSPAGSEQEEVIKRHGFETVTYEVERAILVHGAADNREYGCFAAMDAPLVKVLARYKRNDDIEREAARAMLRRRQERIVVSAPVSAPSRRRESRTEHRAYDSGTTYDTGLWPIMDSSPLADTYHETPHFEPGGGHFGGAGATGGWEPSSSSHDYSSHDSGSSYDSGSSGGYDGGSSGGFDGGGCDGGGGGGD